MGKSDKNVCESMGVGVPETSTSLLRAISNDSEWRVSLMEIALRQVLADETIHERTREVFRRVAVNGEKPDAVAHSFGIARNAVDQMKNRVMTRLKALVRNLERADG